ncbi:tyrosine-type recombinase/integrase [Caballeronia cordobensis]|uniref:tyrosine-type recombinase/integrase n=1 Tax=Caballeronia cordobensis TaxID=1353886 RepID=UPI00045EEE8B|nr:putative membrane protein [Burkholderia sp. RPE67]
MFTPVLTDERLIEKLLAHLRAEGYSLRIQRWYPARVRQFLNYCHRNGLSIETVSSGHVTQFLRGQYRLSRKRNSNLPPLQQWQHRYTGAINMMLRLVRGAWPVPDPPSTPLEGFHRDIARAREYDTWLRDLRGLHPLTRAKRTMHALNFLSSLGHRADEQRLKYLSVQELDAYLKQCCVGLRRASIEDRTVCLRDFLRHLWRTGRTAADLAGTVIGPDIYEHEGIPVALRTEDVTRVPEVTRRDVSPVGLRDYAILSLLSTYGLRAAEVVNLHLEDIDWRRDILRVRHTKTGTSSGLPLLPEPGEALLRYLEKARPPSVYREVFLRIQVPYRPFKNGSILNCIMNARLRAAGITPQGRKGPSRVSPRACR